MASLALVVEGEQDAGATCCATTATTHCIALQESRWPSRMRTVFPFNLKPSAAEHGGACNPCRITRRPNTTLAPFLIVTACRLQRVKTFRAHGDGRSARARTHWVRDPEALALRCWQALHSLGQQIASDRAAVACRRLGLLPRPVHASAADRSAVVLTARLGRHRVGVSRAGTSDLPDGVAIAPPPHSAARLKQKSSRGGSLAGKGGTLGSDRGLAVVIGARLGRGRLLQTKKTVMHGSYARRRTTLYCGAGLAANTQSGSYPFPATLNCNDCEQRIGRHEVSGKSKAERPKR